MFPGKRWKGLSWTSCGILGEKEKGIAALRKSIIFSCVVVFCFHFFFFSYKNVVRKFSSLREKQSESRDW